MKQNNVIEWLDTKATRSTIFISFGSEYFLSSDDLEEIAYGLEMSNVNFIWVLRFPNDENKTKLCHLVFLKGLQIGNKNPAGFVSHCGWSSVMEAMKFGVPIIAMPMHLDQPVNARVVVEVGVGVEVVKDKNGRFTRENISASVQHVVASKSGEAVRQKAKKMSVDLRVKGDEEINVVVDELLHLCKSSLGEGFGFNDGSKLLQDEDDDD